MAFHILDEVKRRPRSEWQQMGREQWTRLRIWIQENGEAAFCLGLALGFLVVVFHKLFIALLALSVIALGIFYIISPEDDELTVKSDTANGTVEDSTGDNSTGDNSTGDNSTGDNSTGDNSEDAPVEDKSDIGSQNIH